MRFAQIFAAIVLTISVRPVASATTYYVDSSIADPHIASATPDCTNYSPSSFTCSGGTASAYKTIADINHKSLLPGDSVLFRKGQIWREQLTVASSGTSGNPIKFAAFGTGAAPVVDGSDLFSVWVSAGGASYYATCSIEPKQAFQDGSRLTKVESITDLVAGSFFFDVGASRLYVQTTRSDNPNSHSMAASQRGRAIVIDTHDYVTISGLMTTKSNDHGIASFTSTGTLIDGVESSYNFMTGFVEYRASGAERVTVQNSSVHHNGGIGIEIDASDGSLVSANAVFNNDILALDVNQDFGGGIKLVNRATVNTIIEKNDVYANGTGTNSDGDAQDRAGIWLDTVGAGNIVRYNDVHANLKYGIFNEASAGNIVHGNVVWGQAENVFARGLLIGRGSQNVLVYNNTVYGNRYGLSAEGDNLSSGRYDSNTFTNNISAGNVVANFRAVGGGQNDTTNGTANVYIYNAFGAEAANFIEWGAGTFKSTYAAFEAAYGSPTHSVTSDPLFTNAPGHDFSLQLSSPVISHGSNVGSAYRYGLSSMATWPSGVATLDQIANGPGWEIGAYVSPEVCQISVRVDGTVLYVDSAVSACVGAHP